MGFDTIEINLVLISNPEEKTNAGLLFNDSY